MDTVGQLNNKVLNTASSFSVIPLNNVFSLFQSLILSSPTVSAMEQKRTRLAESSTGQAL